MRSSRKRYILACHPPRTLQLMRRQVFTRHDNRFFPTFGCRKEPVSDTHLMDGEGLSSH